MKRRQILIADSGSTKTDWAVLEKRKDFSGKAAALSAGSGSAFSPSVRFRTEGINPFYQDDEAISRTLAEACRELRAATAARDGGEETEVEVHFYGAGCTEVQIPRMEALLEAAFRPAGCAAVEAKGDLLAAARALCGHESGIACILGTGSNSCVYDGETIRDNVSPLGFILGDEGSGAVLGKLLVGSLLKGQLPAALRDEFLAAYGLTPSDLVERVYRRPFPNRFLAGFAPFLSERLDLPEIRAFCREAFAAFFRRNVLLYPEARKGNAGSGEPLPVHFTGSVAYHFRSLLRPLAEEFGLRPGRFAQSPLDGLARYHGETAEEAAP